ncbi:bifunctional adenosylcobinamide kinase/adenosylcobinamide-phosphate guanylyltransferase [Filomicrobium insigne]|nr:bifunctional adenosylcobinamide kinase/adenosylcobinamide-phosphate guanylyltransferase [Filomicrobium insigne]
MPSEPNNHITLVLGGARSGKSKKAESLVMALPPPWIYVATAQAFDDEMRERLEAHKERRDDRWATVEEPLDLAQAVRDNCEDDGALLVDCLTLWLSNVMLAGRSVEWESDALLAAIKEARGTLVIVSNEVGLGIVPDNKLAREFRDAQGLLNQRVAEIADNVILMAAGLPLTLK